MAQTPKPTTEAQPEKKEQAPASEPKAEDQAQKPKQTEGSKVKKEEEKKPAKKGYRLQDKKSIEINRKHQDIRGRAELMKEIGFGLFGHRRFKRIELTCSLNLFYTALRICSIFHRGVADLFLIVELESIHYTQFENEEDKNGQEKEHSIFRITLTKYPTATDKKSSGYHEAFTAEQVKNPFRMPERRKANRNNRKDDRRGGDRKGRNDDRPDRRDDRGDRKGDRAREGDKNDRKAHKREKDEYYDRPRRNDGRRGDQNRGQDRDQTRNRRQPRETRDNRDTRDRGDRDRQYRSYRERDDREDRGGRNTRPERYDRDNRERYGARQGQGERRYEQRGQAKSRGTGKVAPHNYSSSHIRQEAPKRTEDRGDRAPPRRKNNRYVEEEEW